MAYQLNFNSDNCTGACPEVMDALIAANSGERGSYGIDAETARVAELLKAAFETEALQSYPVATGTAANALAVASSTASYQALFCTRAAHLYEDELGAPELFSGGCKLISVDELPGDENAGKMDPAHLAELLAHLRPVVHESQAAAVSITQPTEYGTVYSLDEIRTISAIAKRNKLLFHMDGARFGNALANLGCTPAEMTWRSGVDILSFGATKNGAMCAESSVYFESAVDSSTGERAAAQSAGEYTTGVAGPRDLRVQAPWSLTVQQAADRVPIHRKRTGHLFSKMRYISAQLVGYLEGDVWKKYARNANIQAASLAKGLAALPGFSLLYPTEINMVHIEMPVNVLEALQADGFGLAPRRMRPGDKESGMRYARLVTSWSTTEADVQHFIDSAVAHLPEVAEVAELSSADSTPAAKL